ncbi:GNAT family N-acetyltransferase [Roseofilum sp. BLCC_M154]|uniref:GNAT family N-acetyltransferase n=1 Tax=Roseofilum acuticapitatum BLCC-M154 TaxID=3022444 RepID=A0ABT7ATK6_9CYAN|nr:GNAT family N-acetyltransferase [Roseofilum acuticapitatum]MDJ1169388.1 GNAT family N-acetyltransferase [Roseofilum acuticapitatum BLCC-M154]
MNSISIRQAEEQDLSLLDRAFQSAFKRTHRDDIIDQQAQILSFYVAWLDSTPVGHGFVRWISPRHSTVRATFPHCPEIYRLEVLEEFRGRSIGTQIISHCEGEAISRGFNTIGLGVSLNNPKASKLYHRLGYKQLTVIEYLDEYKRQRNDGTIEQVRDPLIWLTKFLDVSDRSTINH